MRYEWKKMEIKRPSIDTRPDETWERERGLLEWCFRGGRRDRDVRRLNAHARPHESDSNKPNPKEEVATQQLHKKMEG